jgi:glutaminyl-tRNA synthetase
MRAGKYPDGSRVLRAKIDMTSPNLNMRDPVLYRIQHATHHNTGDTWCIYPMYDYAHPLEDAIEGITHSLCSLEFEDHRPLYDWVVEHCEMEHVPRQIEFGKLYIAKAVTGKRYIRQLVEEGHAMGWDDPRLITLSGLRRRGIPSQAIMDFILALGLPKSQGETEIEMLYQLVRERLNVEAKNVNAVLDPLKLVIENYPEGQVEYVEAENNRSNPELGSRKLPFSRVVYIEREDFIEEKPNKKWKRLALGVEVRLMHAYFVTAHSVVKDEQGNILEVRCTYDPATKSGSGFNDRKPNGNIHYVDGTEFRTAEFRLFDDLVLDMDDKDKPFAEKINPDSLQVKHGVIEASVSTEVGERYQFIRNGFYAVDPDTTDEQPVFNRIIGLRSSFQSKANS